MAEWRCLFRGIIMSVRDDIYGQIVGALAGAKFPIATPEKLLAAFPNGAETTCRSGDVSLKAGDAGKVLTEKDFPFKSAADVAKTICDRAGL
jgi:hypothetical protein